MPVLPSDLFTNTYRRASDLPQAVWDALRSDPRNANVVLPATIKALADEQAGLGHEKNTWITCSSYTTIEFILSVTEGYMGSYPVFIFTTLPYHALTKEYIQPCINALTQALKAAVSRRRVYSIFAPDPVAILFAEEWSRLTGIATHPEAYYAAKISFCTIDKLDKRKATIDQSLGYELRPAVANDIPAIAELCFLFADDSVRILVQPQRALPHSSVP